MVNKKKYIVLGAGPTGMIAAWKLIQEGHEVVLVERAEHVGGFGASFEYKGFHLDYGPHALHIKEGEVIPIAKEVLGKYLLRNKSNIRSLYNGRQLRYPFQFWNLMMSLGLLKGLRMIFDFVVASLIYKFIHVPDDNFESWGIKRFGKTLYDFCFGKYTEKVWGMPPRLISPKFAAKKIQRLNIKKIISKIFGGKGEEHEIYWEDLLYPEKGSGELFHKMADQFKAKGGILHLKATVTELERDANRIKSVKFEKNGKTHAVEADYVISSLPIRNMILMITPSFGDYISYTAKRLRFRGMIFVYLILDTERVTEAHWIYLLDPVFKFNRVTEQRNLSAACCPPGKTVLCFELCAGSNEEIWNYTDEQLKALVMEEIKKIKVIDPVLISDCLVRRKEDAYAICYIDFDKQLKDLLEHLSNVQNLLTTGRQGLYNQIDMHDSMALGLSAARFFMEGQRNHFDWYKEKTSHLDWDR